MLAQERTQVLSVLTKGAWVGWRDFGGRSRDKVPGPGSPDGWSGPDYVAYIYFWVV